MGYVEDTLGSGETIEYDVSFHWLWTFSAYTIFVIMGAAALALYLVLGPMTSIEETEPMIRLIPSLLLAVIGLVIFLYMMIKKWTTERVLTDIRFIQKTGWIVRHTEEIRMSTIGFAEGNLLSFSLMVTCEGRTVLSYYIRRNRRFHTFWEFMEHFFRLFRASLPCL